MAIHRAVIILVLGGIAMSLAAQEATRELFVAPDGSDASPGTLEQPFATPARARDAARDLGRIAPVTISLRGGTYELEQPLELTPEDSGTADAPLTWAAYEGERPMLSGGRVIEGWEEGEEGLWTVMLPEVATGDWTFRQLFAKREGEDYFTRRYRPSKGALVIAGLTNAPAREGMAHRRSQDEFRFEPGDLEPWENLDDVEIVALHDWSASRLRIRELDLEAQVVRFTGFPVYRIGAWWKDGRNPYYAENVKEALGEPGEWYLDRPTGVLSYRPLPGEDMTDLTFVAPRTGQLVRMLGDTEAGLPIEHVRFEGLTFLHTHWELPAEGYSSGQGMTDLPAALQAIAANRCEVEACTFANLGAYAVELSGGSSENSVLGNRMYDLGGGGVKVGGGAGVPKANVVADNVISDGGLVHFSAHGIWSGITDGTVISHNVVRRLLYSNVSIGWSWNDKPTACRANVVEYNHIHDAMMLLADGGGIYSLGFIPDTVIRGNHIHDVRRSKFAGRAPNNGIFLDQGSKDFRIEGNAIHDTAGAIIRHNQNQPEWHEWVDNHFDVEPPADIVANAGLEPEYRHLDEGLPPVRPTPILSMTLPPPPPPGPIIDDFEPNTRGNGPQKRQIHGTDENARIELTDETAASGTHCVKLVDSPLAKKPFYPMLMYKPEYVQGDVTVSFSLRMEEGATVTIEGRDYTTKKPFSTGPVLRVTEDLRLLAGREEVAALPLSEWVRLELKFAVGGGRPDLYTLQVDLPDAGPVLIEGLTLASETFVQFDWFAFTCSGTRDAAFYVDDVSINNE